MKFRTLLMGLMLSSLPALAATTRSDLAYASQRLSEIDRSSLSGQDQKRLNEVQEKLSYAIASLTPAAPTKLLCSVRTSTMITKVELNVESKQLSSEQQDTWFGGPKYFDNPDYAKNIRDAKNRCLALESVNFCQCDLSFLKDL